MACLRGRGDKELFVLLNRSTSSSLSVYLSAYLEMSNSMASMKSEDVLFDLLEKHGARPSVSGVDWARQNWRSEEHTSELQSPQ